MDPFAVTYLVGGGVILGAELIAVFRRRGMGDTITEKTKKKLALRGGMQSLLAWATYHFIVEESPSWVVDVAVAVLGGAIGVAVGVKNRRKA